jgi:hypothetical protein
METQEMDSVAVRSVNEMPIAEKRSLESLVGRQLEDNQQVFIMSYTPGVVPGDEARAAAMAGLSQTWEKVERHMQKHGVTEEEFGAGVDEAVEQVRR